MSEATVTSKGQVTIPADIRKAPTAFMPRSAQPLPGALLLSFDVKAQTAKR